MQEGSILAANSKLEQPLPTLSSLQRYIKAHTCTDKESTALQISTPTVEDCFDCQIKTRSSLFQTFCCLCEGLSKHTCTNLQKQICSCPRSWLPTFLHQPEVVRRGRADWNALVGNKIQRRSHTKSDMADFYLKRPSCVRNTSFPGCSYFEMCMCVCVWRNLIRWTQLVSQKPKDLKIVKQ